VRCCCLGVSGVSDERAGDLGCGGVPRDHAEHGNGEVSGSIQLNQTMVRLTWATVVLTLIVLGATLYLGLR
jgi:hypothetical protein